MPHSDKKVMPRSDGAMSLWLLVVIASEAKQSRKNQILNPKSEILNNVKEQSAVSNQQSTVSGEPVAEG